MKLTLTYVAFVILALTSSNQNRENWNEDLYSSLTNENFRQSSLLNASLDLENIDYARIDAAVFFVTNEKRITYGLEPLDFHPLLEQMASGHSRDMASDAFFDHHNHSDKSKFQPKDRAILVDIENPYIAENIYYSGGKEYESYLTLADATLNALMDSPPHKKNILHESAIELGCGLFYHAGLWKKKNSNDKHMKGVWMATQNFQFYQNIEGSSDQ